MNYKKKNTLIKSLVAPYTLTIEHKEHKTKELKNKSTIHNKNSINSKQNSNKANNNMASKKFPAVNSIDFHVNKLMPKSDTAESKNHVLLPLSYEEEDLPIQAAVTTTTTTTINSRNNAITNNNTVNDTNIILIQSNTTTATNNRRNNKDTDNNAVNDSNKLLTPTSASTTTTNNNTNSVNAHNSENNNSSKLIPSSIDEERNKSEKYVNAAKQDAKEKIPVLNSEQWKKETTLIIGDSILAGLREAKPSRSKRIKVRYFPR